MTAGADEPGPAGPEAVALAAAREMTVTAADVLVRRGLAGRREDDETTDDDAGAVATTPDLDEWLSPRLAHLTPPDGMADLEAAIDRIARGIRNRERITVFGDYDADGITSAAMLTETLTRLGADTATVIASRFAGGYGFSEPALQRVRATGASLLVTCDCGSSDHERLAAAAKAGIDVVVIDHHLVPPEPLPAIAFLNPHRPDCQFPFKGLASCGLIVFVAAALRRALGAKLDVRRSLDLAAVGTIADVAPLTGDNRILVRAGLKRLGRPGSRPGLEALVRGAFRGRLRPLSAEDVAYQIAPRINAPGRLGDPTPALELLLSRDPAEAVALADRIERVTTDRRALQRKMVAEAVLEIGDRGYARDPAIVLARDDWHPGIVGIVAGHIADRYDKPTVVIALEGPAGRGSARGPDGFRLYDALSASASALLGFGGHQAAAGIEVASERVPQFREAFIAASRSQRETQPPRPPRHAPEVRLDPRDEVMSVLADLERLEPCGEGNPPPKVLFEGLAVVGRRAIREHLKLEVVLGTMTVGAFGPDMADRLATLPSRVSIVGHLRRDHYRGGEQPELLITALI
ncbi:MAG: single-stranded-DNA-specific exonuclease RecJ [Myxococcota bacterium]